MGDARQPVDHRNGRVPGQLAHHVVVEQADHHRVDIAREHARGVGDGLLAGELHVAAAHHDVAAAELRHADIEGDARARGMLVEDQRQHAALERRVGVGRAARKTGARLLAALGLLQHPA